MIRFAVRSGSAIVAVALGLCLFLGAQSAHAQSAPIQYGTLDWLGFGGALNAGEGTSASGFASTRYNFENGMFVGSQRGAVSGFNQSSAFGSLTSESVQFGYNFKNAPVTVFAGFDTMKYNSGLGSALAPFESMSGTAPGYGVHAGVEFKPTSNLSLSFGVGYVEQSGRIVSDTPSPSLSNASQFDLVRGRR